MAKAAGAAPPRRRTHPPPLVLYMAHASGVDVYEVSGYTGVSVKVGSHLWSSPPGIPVESGVCVTAQMRTAE